MADSATITANVEDGATISGSVESSAIITSSVAQGQTIVAEVTPGGRGPQGEQGEPGVDGIDAPSDHTLLDNIGTNTHAQIDTALAAAASHIASTSNPHSVTKAQVGLSDVPNLDTTTAVSQTHTHANAAALNQVSGINTGDQDLSPYATTTALTTGLTGKANTSHTHSEADITDLGDYATSTELTTGLASKADSSHNHDTDYADIAHTHTEADITDLGDYLESVDVADINATGTADGTTYLRGDGTWSTPAGGGGGGGVSSQWEDTDGGIKYHQYEVFDKVQYFLTLVSGSSSVGWTDITTEAGSTMGTVSGDILGVIGDYFYTGKTDTYDGIYFDIGTAKTATGVLSFEYWNGTEWSALTVTDNTNGLNVDGSVDFDPPADWATTSVNGSDPLYYVRIGVASGTFTAEPTVYVVVPGRGAPVMEVFPNGNDTTPSLVVDKQGGVAIGYANSATYRFRVNGTGYFSSSVYGGGGLTAGAGISTSMSSLGFTHTPGLSAANATSSSATAPVQNSPTIRLSGTAWDGATTRTNAMEMYMQPDSENAVTAGRWAFKNQTINGSVEATELANISSNGRMNVLGRIESYYDTFDKIFSYVGTTFTDLTPTVSSMSGTFTGDVLNVVGDWVYIGKSEQFASAYFNFQTIISGTTARDWEYWNGTAWTNFTPDSDGTTDWRNDGTMTFTPPVDWATTTVNNVSDLYWIRVGTVSSAFTTEPTLRLLLPTSDMYDDQLLIDSDLDDATKWSFTGGWANTTNDFTYTHGTGSGTITQPAANFRNAAKPNTWYRMRYIMGVAAPTGTTLWIGEEFADGKVYFTGSTTEVDVYFRTNSNPGDFKIYTTSTTTSGARIDFISVMECKGGDIRSTGDLIPGAENGVVLTSPNGTRYRLTIDDDGTLMTGAL